MVAKTAQRQTSIYQTSWEKQYTYNINYFGILAFEMTPVFCKWRSYLLMRQIFTVVEVWMVILWILTSCGHVGGYQRFGGTCYPHLHDKSGASKLLLDICNHLYDYKVLQPWTSQSLVININNYLVLLLHKLVTDI